MKCRACGHEEAHDDSERSCRHIGANLSFCPCRENDRQIAALRAGLENAHALLRSYVEDEVTIRRAVGRIVSALKEAE